MDSTAIGYSAGALSHELPTEHERLQVLEAACDPISKATLREIPVPAGAHILEIGAGAGSVARFLAAAHPRSRVTATDLDIRFLGDPKPNLTLMRHDVAVDDFPPGHFHLIHARAVLVHVPDRDRVLRRMAAWLAPGGFLTLEEPSLRPGFASGDLPLRKVLRAADELFARQFGFDSVWADTLPASIRGAGLADIHSTQSVLQAGPGERGNAVLMVTLRQLHDTLIDSGLLSRVDISEALRCFTTPGYSEPWMVMITVRSRRPGAVS